MPVPKMMQTRAARPSSGFLRRMGSTQELQVFEVLVTTRGFLVLDQVINADQEYLYGAVTDRHRQRETVGPGVAKLHTANIVDQINAIGRDTELEDHSRLGEFLPAVEVRNVARPELVNCGKKLLHIRIGAVVEDIHVTGRADVAVVDHGFAADNQIPDVVFVKQGDKVAGVRGEQRRV